MKMNNSAQELLMRYLLGVKRELGGKDSDDIAAEIESYIGDLLEERYSSTEEIGTEELEAVLKEMGAPRKVARLYGPQRYLIGPRLFPVYWLVLRILVAVVAGSLALSYFISIGIQQEMAPALGFLEFLGSVFSGVLAAAGSVTIVFGCIERGIENHELDEIKEMDEFKLSDLPDLPEKEHVFHPAGAIVEIIVTILGMAFFTYLRFTNGALPYFINPNEFGGMGRIFTDNFLQFIPVILVLNGLEIGRAATLLAQGRYTALTNWWAIIDKGANMVLSVFLLNAMPLVTLEFFRQIPGLNPGPQADGVANTVLSILIGLSIVGSLVDIIRSTIQEVRNPTY
ncbi:HAAS signaling domain-containing protein [Pelolinea submarina]|uniref:Uncharacterized protein n=1 Tax=Pelolinea submarina TaxID=913107 RepID=A0A347ZQU1_9CHLR|nr:hypothetical protein [Pelolinea submarina]REG11773.1 hypothetical protein DFR64_1665 [Pelolinea submarina]BBB47672.1 hypothetical protein Pelsub_P0899 [Pelolinea submarina]